MLTLIMDGQSRVNELTLRGIGPEDLSPEYVLQRKFFLYLTITVHRERRDQNMFKKLVNMVPNLEDRLWDQCCNPDEKKYIAEMV